jgi:hypothetical protein
MFIEVEPTYTSIHVWVLSVMHVHSVLRKKEDISTSFFLIKNIPLIILLALGNGVSVPVWTIWPATRNHLTILLYHEHENELDRLQQEQSHLQKCVSGVSLCITRGCLTGEANKVTLFASEERGEAKIHPLYHRMKKCIANHSWSPTHQGCSICPSARPRAHLAPRSFSSRVELSIALSRLVGAHTTSSMAVAHGCGVDAFANILCC